MLPSGAPTHEWQRRLSRIRLVGEDYDARLERDVVAGLQAFPQRTLPARFLYDEAGSALFDRICNTVEYYPTRTELALLTEVSGRIAEATRATILVELGSGTARKTHVLLRALGASERPVHYVPLDVSESSILHAAASLLPRFPHLTMEGWVGDFSEPSPSLPSGERRLVALMGGTIGNFDESETVTFLRNIRRLMHEGEHLLLAADLVKDQATLHAAYNDSEGVTEAFNRNVLDRLRRDLGFEVNPRCFAHEAFYNPGHARIEMHLRARMPTSLRSERLGVDIELARNESIRTEISRKFTSHDLMRLMETVGFHVVELFRKSPPYALVLAGVSKTEA